MQERWLFKFVRVRFDVTCQAGVGTENEFCVCSMFSCRERFKRCATSSQYRVRTVEKKNDDENRSFSMI
jgi:hypothetical protein